MTEFDDVTIKEAIRKEIKREGADFLRPQPCLLHLPDGRAAPATGAVGPSVAVAHGQMNEDELEKVMISFMNKEIDLLVCTTIIESGLDISAANTILINRADRFGLSQIYQLRGRVGRSDEQAYAYLFIPADSVMTKDAQKRLKVLMEHSDLGSGFPDRHERSQDPRRRHHPRGLPVGPHRRRRVRHVPQAHGKLHGRTERGTAGLRSLDPEINIPISAFLPESYMPDIDQRLTAYRRLARITEPKEYR